MVPVNHCSWIFSGGVRSSVADVDSVSGGWGSSGGSVGSGVSWGQWLWSRDLVQSSQQVLVCTSDSFEANDPALWRSLCPITALSASATPSADPANQQCSWADRWRWAARCPISSAGDTSAPVTERCVCDDLSLSHTHTCISLCVCGVFIHVVQSYTLATTVTM